MIKCLIIGVIILHYVSAIDNIQKNVSCSNIETPEGFKFSHGCAAADEISANYNGTMIARKFGEQYHNLHEVRSMDNDSVVTRECRDLQVKCILLDTHKPQHVKEIHVTFQITGEKKKPDPVHLPETWNHISVTIILSVSVVTVISVIVGVHFWHRKKKMNRLSDAVTVSSCCLREGTSQAASSETGETGSHEVREDAGGDVESAISLVEISSATDPNGSNDNDTEQDTTLETVLAHSIHPQTDGKSPHTHNLNHNLADDGIQPTTNGAISAPDVNIASLQRAMNRNLSGDPGGENHNKGKDMRIREVDNGCIPVDRDLEDHETEGQLLLSNQRASIRGSDKTGEAAALVNNCGFDPDQVSRCSAAPETDVESKPKMKNHNTYTY